MCLHYRLASVECVLGPKCTTFHNLRSEKVNVRQWGAANTEPCGPRHSEVPQGSHVEGSRGPSCGPGLPCIWQGVDAWGQTRPRSAASLSRAFSCVSLQVLVFQLLGYIGISLADGDYAPSLCSFVCFFFEMYMTL